MGDEREDPWDETVEESFPASDPPAWGGSIGGPQDPADAAKRLQPARQEQVAVQKDPGAEPSRQLHPERRG